MGYSDLDKLAINTIRVLAVCFPPPWKWVLHVQLCLREKTH